MVSFLLHLALSALAGDDSRQPPPVATFSIAACDPGTGEIGVAVQSKFIAVGSVVPWAKAGVGAVATQSFANLSYGPRGLKLLQEGKAPAEAIALLTADDTEKEQRQVGIISADGRTAHFTGKGCLAWAGGKSGRNFTVQGNILAGEEVITAMAGSFTGSAGKGSLSQRLIDALAAGQAAGGDRRGRQSAALLVVREDWGYGGNNDRFRDLRVDDHATPVAELKRIYNLHRKIFTRPDEKK
jgi:uncharacterized Ntn-hydrolase superfamily protein